MGGVAAILVLPASLIVASLVSLPLYLHTSLEKDDRVTALLDIASRYFNAKFYVITIQTYYTEYKIISTIFICIHVLLEIKTPMQLLL